MKLKYSYNYKELCGIVKFKLYYENTNDINYDPKLYVNGVECKLSFDKEYISEFKMVEFGLNTYAISNNRSNFDLNISLVSSDNVVDQLNIACSNDPSIHDFIYEKAKLLPILIGLPIDSDMFDGLNRDIFPSPYLTGKFNSEYNTKGFIHIEKFFTTNFMDEVASELDYYCEKNYKGYEEGSSERIQQLHSLGGKFTALFKDLSIRKILYDIYGVEMLPCQSLAYKYGSQQSVHSDFIHLTPYPVNLMCGVWVALEDVQIDSGELVIYPGSQKEKSLKRKDLNLDYVLGNDYSAFEGTLSDEWKRLSRNYLPHKALLKKGDVLVWDANLLHEGSIRKIKEITRRSVVFHYFGKGAFCYYDSTGDIGFSGEIAV